MLRIVLLALSVIFAAGLLFVNIYTSIVDAPNWGSSLPESISVARQYYSVANPGTFFRVASPLNQALAVICLIACWRSGRVRYYAIAALLLAVLADVITFGYFYPRNYIIFEAPIETSLNGIRQAIAEWSSMNWVRSGICMIQLFLAMSMLVMTTKKQADL